MPYMAAFFRTLETNSPPCFLYLYFYFSFYNCIDPFWITPLVNSGCLPLGKPAATESRYPTYSVCVVL